MSRELTNAEVKVLTKLSYKKSIKKEQKMSKALDAFYDLVDVYWDNEIVKEKYVITEKTFSEKKKIVETALKRLEIIDKLNEKHCEDTQKKLKALEIIKEKPYLLLFTDFNLTYEEFVEQAEEDYGNDLPSKEEYDLIKEVLCKDNM